MDDQATIVCTAGEILKVRVQRAGLFLLDPQQHPTQNVLHVDWLLPLKKGLAPQRGRDRRSIEHSYSTLLHLASS